MQMRSIQTHGVDRICFKSRLLPVCCLTIPLLCFAQDAGTLKSQDVRLNELYTQRVAQVQSDPSALAVLRGQERNWIRQRDHQCGADIACLTQATKTRADYLRDQASQNDSKTRAGSPIPDVIRGEWTVTRVFHAGGASCWDESQASSLLGTHLTFTADHFSWNKTSLRNLDAQSQFLSAKQFLDENSGSSGSARLEDFGIHASSAREIVIQHQDAKVFSNVMDCCASVPGDRVLMKSKDAGVLNVCGLFYGASRNDR